MGEEVSALLCDDIFGSHDTGSDADSRTLKDECQLAELMVCLVVGKATLLRLLDHVVFEVVTACIAALQDKQVLFIQECHIVNRHVFKNYIVINFVSNSNLIFGVLGFWGFGVRD